MLTEDSGPPNRIPWQDVPGGIPVEWVATQDLQPDDLQPGGALYDIVEGARVRIPAAVIAALSGQPERVEYQHRTGKLRMRLARFTASSFLRAQNPRGSIIWAGVYTAPASNLPVTNSFDAAGSTASTIIHEYGHHVDNTYRQFVLGATNTISLTNDSSRPFDTLYLEAQPTILSTAYSRTNKMEWFAEAWTAQLMPWTEARFMDEIAGGSVDIATRTRRAFTALFPGQMPAFCDGKFD